MQAAVTDGNAARRGSVLALLGITALIGLALALSIDFTPASAGAIADASLPAPVEAPQAQAQVCGNGSAPDYGFSDDLQQAHWTVGWQGYASQEAVAEVDAVLDQLNADFIAQTMILIKSQDQVGNRVNCAVHFLRYMQLGEVAGARKDNGFVFLIVVEPGRIDVHYGVGLGLPALTAPDLTTLNRAAEDSYQSTQSLDQALLTLVRGFDTLARSKYAPLTSSAPAGTSGETPLPSSQPLGILSICGLLCLGIFFLLFLIWGLPLLARSGISFNRPGPGESSWQGSDFPSGEGRNGPSMRGGSGSGRSGRGN